MMGFYQWGRSQTQQGVRLRPLGISAAMSARTYAPRFLLALLATLLALTGSWLGAEPARADDGLVSSITAAPARILADGGQSSISVRVVTVGDTAAAEVTLTTTLGAFGSAGGPNRVVLALEPGADGIANANARLFGDGRRGTTAVVARVGESIRSITVVLVGAPAQVEFESPETNAVRSAEVTPRIVLRVRDADGSTVPTASLQLSTDAGTLKLGDQIAPALSLTTDVHGRAAAFLRAEPGTVELMARAGDATARLTLTVHGPTVSLELVALRTTINLGDDPFPAPPGTLVAILIDDGGRPVTGRRVIFSVEPEGTLVQHGAGGESPVTDSGGRARGHLSAAAATQPALIMVTAVADGYADSVQVRIVGPPTQVRLEVSPSGSGVYQLEATLRDADGFLAPTGFEVVWEALDVDETATAIFAPAESTTRNGVATTVLTLTGQDAGAVQVRGTVVASDPPLNDTVALPVATEGATGTPLVAGLNVVLWAGGATSIDTVIRPIAPLVAAAWHLDPVAGWQGYFPTADPGGGFPVERGDRLHLFLSAAATLVSVVAASDEPPGR